MSGKLYALSYSRWKNVTHISKRLSASHFVSLCSFETHRATSLYSPWLDPYMLTGCLPQRSEPL
ncbi:hypothetical protein Q6249_29920, partial [Klebsiella pneumoniae]|uniref:hypothetical protein n=1 Tax=Klebsiella pneumoniae TaxID=573 RepID=UPI002731E503